MSKPSPKLLKLWYKKLTDTGFTDIERGKDQNMFPASTLPGNHRTMHLDYADPENDEDQHIDEEIRSLVNDEKAVYWRKFQDRANAIVEGNEYKQFLLDIADSGSIEETRKDYGYTRWQARYIVANFMKATNMGRTRADNTKDDPEPGPVRTLTKAEIAGLDYKCPRQIKDGTDDSHN